MITLWQLFFLCLCANVYLFVFLNKVEFEKEILTEKEESQIISCLVRGIDHPSLIPAQRLFFAHWLKILLEVKYYKIVYILLIFCWSVFNEYDNRKNVKIPNTKAKYDKQQPLVNIRKNIYIYTSNRKSICAEMVQAQIGVGLFTKKNFIVCAKCKLTKLQVLFREFFSYAFVIYIFQKFASASDFFPRHSVFETRSYICFCTYVGQT